MNSDLYELNRYLQSYYSDYFFPKVNVCTQNENLIDSTFININGCNTDKLPPIGRHLLRFDLLDTLINNEYPDLECESFAKKFEALPNETSIQEIKKNIYQILIVIRNGIVHERNKVDFTHGTILVERGTKTLSLNSNEAKFLNTIILLLFIDSNIKSTAFYERLLISYYKMMVVNSEFRIDNINNFLNFDNSDIQEDFTQILFHFCTLEDFNLIKEKNDIRIVNEQTQYLIVNKNNLFFLVSYKNLHSIELSECESMSLENLRNLMKFLKVNDSNSEQCLSTTTNDET